MFEFAKIRDFGSLFEDSFVFFRQNAKNLFLPFLIFFGIPALILGSVSIYTIGKSLFTLSKMSNFAAPETQFIGTIFSMAGVFIVLSLLLALLMQAFIFASINLAIDRTEINTANIAARMKDELSVTVSTVFLNLVFTLVVMGVGMLIGFIPCIGTIIFYIIMYFWYAASTMVFPVRYQEGLGYFDGLQRAFQLLKDHWWQTVGVFIVVSLVLSVVMGILFIPLMVVGFYGVDLFQRTGDIPSGMMIGGTLGALVLTILVCFLNMIPYISIYLQYFNLIESKEGTDLEAQIDAL